MPPKFPLTPVLFYIPSTNRPGLKTPFGSNFAFTSRISQASAGAGPHTLNADFHSLGHRCTTTLPAARHVVSMLAACSFVKSFGQQPKTIPVPA